MKWQVLRNLNRFKKKLNNVDDEAFRSSYCTKILYYCAILIYLNIFWKITISINVISYDYYIVRIKNKLKIINFLFKNHKSRHLLQIFNVAKHAYKTNTFLNTTFVDDQSNAFHMLIKLFYVWITIWQMSSSFSFIYRFFFACFYNWKLYVEVFSKYFLSFLSITY